MSEGKSLFSSTHPVTIAQNVTCKTEELSRYSVEVASDAIRLKMIGDIEFVENKPKSICVAPEFIQTLAENGLTLEEWFEMHDIKVKVTYGSEEVK